VISTEKMVSQKCASNVGVSAYPHRAKGLWKHARSVGFVTVEEHAGSSDVEAATSKCGCAKHTSQPVNTLDGCDPDKKNGGRAWERDHKYLNGSMDA